MKIKFICNAARWRDKVNGNTYHSVRVTRVKDGKQIVRGLSYGYGDHYRQTALKIMVENKWIPKEYAEKPFMYERENGYPISWNVTDGLKRACIANGTL